MVFLPLQPPTPSWLLVHISFCQNSWNYELKKFKSTILKFPRFFEIFQKFNEGFLYLLIFVEYEEIAVSRIFFLPFRWSNFSKVWKIQFIFQTVNCENKLVRFFFRFYNLVQNWCLLLFSSIDQENLFSHPSLPLPSDYLFAYLLARPINKL